jgi:hypothetical protein
MNDRSVIWSGTWRGSRWRHAVVMVALFIVALVVLAYEASMSPFEGDEADYVATSRYFGYLFEDGGVTRPEWDDNHWTRTQPPLTRYIVGAWLSVRGYDLDQLNQPYVSTASSLEVNRRKGRVPSDDVLAAARQPMVVLGAATIMMLYPLGVLIGGLLAGLAAVGLALTSAFLRYTLVHAWGEAPLAFFLLLSALLTVLVARRLLSGGRYLVPCVALGLSLGLASATKLTGLVGVSIAAVLPLIVALIGRPVPPGRWRAIVAGTALAVGLAVAVMIVLNPYLWRGPISGLASMVGQRQAEMAAQQEQWPEYAVLEMRERPWLVAVGSTRVGPWSDVPLVATSIGLGLAALGLVAGVRQSWSTSPERVSLAVLVAWLAAYLLAITVGLGLSYPRYFLPSCLLLIPFSGAGAATIVHAIVQAVWPYVPLPRRESRGERDRRPISAA